MEKPKFVYKCGECECHLRRELKGIQKCWRASEHIPLQMVVAANALVNTLQYLGKK